MRSPAAQTDLLHAWKAAFYIVEEVFPSPGDEQAAQQAVDACPRGARFVQEHVMLLVRHVDADPARLVAAATAARVRHAELDSEDQPPESPCYYLVAAALAERGLAMIRDAGAENDPGAQQQLTETIGNKLDPLPEPFRPGIFDRHRLPRRLARRLNLRWQCRRFAVRTARLDIRLAGAPHHIATVTVTLYGEKIGQVAFQVCGSCRRALICMQSVSSHYQGLGLGQRALVAALATAEEYEWTTTPQYETSVRYWRRMSRITGASLTDDVSHAGRCPHMG